jgi:hypothetical protein
MSAARDAHGTSPRLPARALLPLLRRPDLWATAVRQALVLAPEGWWRRAPHLPLPDPDYLRFRLVTANGGDGTGASPRDVGRDLVTYLEWCRTRPLG